MWFTAQITCLSFRTSWHSHFLCVRLSTRRRGEFILCVRVSTILVVMFLNLSPCQGCVEIADLPFVFDDELQWRPVEECLDRSSSMILILWESDFWSFPSIDQYLFLLLTHNFQYVVLLSYLMRFLHLYLYCLTDDTESPRFRRWLRYRKICSQTCHHLTDLVWQ